MNFEIKEIDGLSGSMGHVYSVVLDGKENSLLEDFFSENKEYKKELEEYGNKIYSMSHYTGFRRQYFKLYEGNAGDGVRY